MQHNKTSWYYCSYPAFIACVAVSVYCICQLFLQSQITIKATSIVNGGDTNKLSWMIMLVHMTGVNQPWISTGTPPSDSFEYLLNQRGHSGVATGQWIAQGFLQGDRAIQCAVTFLCVFITSTLTTHRYRKLSSPRWLSIVVCLGSVAAWWLTFERRESPPGVTWIVSSSGACLPNYYFGIIISMLIVVVFILKNITTVKDCIFETISKNARKNKRIIFAVITACLALIGYLAVYLVTYQDYLLSQRHKRYIQHTFPLEWGIMFNTASVRLHSNAVAEMIWPDGDAIMITYASRDGSLVWSPAQVTRASAGQYTRSFAAAWSIRRHGVWSQPQVDFRPSDPVAGTDDRFRFTVSEGRVVLLVGNHGHTSLYQKPSTLYQSGTGTLNPELGLRLRSLVVQKLGTLEGPIRIDPNTNPLLIPITPSTSPPLPPVNPPIRPAVGPALNLPPGT